MPLYLKDKLVAGSGVGTAGRSAYDQAKKAGYTGTEEEFNQQLANAGNAVNKEYVDRKIEELNAEDVDAYTKEQINTLLSKKSNPNLLDNPWFTVNQRNMTTTLTSDLYGFDRWRGVYGYNTTYKIPSFVADNYIIQRLPENLKENLEGKEVTISVKLLNGSIFTGTVVYQSLSDTWVSVIKNDDIMSVQLTPVNIHNGGAIAITAKSPINIRAVKLELGSISTLANDIAPDYETELAKCQKYFMVIAGSTYLNGIRGYSTNTDIEVPIPGCPMRATPTPILKGLSNIVATDGTSVVTVSSARSAKKDFFVLIADSSLSVRGPVAIYCNDTIWLDANL